MTVGVEGQALEACRKVVEWWSGNRDADRARGTHKNPEWVFHMSHATHGTEPAFVTAARKALIAAREIDG